MLSLRRLYTFFFFLGIFFIPFNSYDGIAFLGEYRREGSIVFILLFMGFFTLEVFFKGKITVPRRSNLLKALVLVLFVFLLCSLVNGSSIRFNYMKQTSGIERLLRQLISLAIVLIYFLLTYNLSLQFELKRIMLLLRKVFLWSFIVVLSYALIELLIVRFHYDALIPFFQLFDYLPFVEVSLDQKFERISSVSLEPPFLAIYLITAAGWMFSYLLDNKLKGFRKFLPAIFLFVLTFFSGSRTALIVISFQFVIFFSFSFSLNQNYRKFIKRFLSFVTIILLVVALFNGRFLRDEINKKISSLNFVENLKNDTSNRTRLGIQYSSLLLFVERPVFGTGFGQQAFHARELYPDWATQNNYEFKDWYLNDSIKSFPPGFNMYTRLLAETGIIGFLTFFFFLFLIVWQLRRLIRRTEGVRRFSAIILLVSFSGFYVNWMQIDSFRIIGFWLCLALLLRILNGQLKTSDE